MLPTKDSLLDLRNTQAESEGIENANGYQKRAGVAIFISDKIEFKANTVIWDKEGYSIIIKDINDL